MANVAVGGGTAVAAPDIPDAIKASGAIVNIGSRGFEAILKKIKAPLVVCAQDSVFTTRYQYLTAYKGLVFFTRTQTPLDMPQDAELINADKIRVPS